MIRNQKKKDMKKLYAIIGLAGALLVPNLYASFDGTAVLNWNPEYPNSGGPFEAAITPNGSTQPIDFTTFCVSIVTTFSPGATYNYDISPIIAANVPPTVPTYITYGTAYIYNQFLNGNVNLVNNPSAVQSTIWYLQGLLNGYTDPENGNDLQGDISAILGNVPLSQSQLIAPANGAFGVEALNLYGAGQPPGQSQPQLIETPEPTTIISGALMLLPFGASTLRILRRNRAA
jgi:hypothetical protein